MLVVPTHQCGNVLLHFPRDKKKTGRRTGDSSRSTHFATPETEELANVEAKVSDFGTVRVNTEMDGKVLRTSERTHVSTERVSGTRPFMPPEYRERGQVSALTDAFAFG